MLFLKSISNFKDTLYAFWQMHPALLYGFCLLIGISFAHYQEPFLLLFLPFVLFSKEKSILSSALILAAIFFTAEHIKMPSLKEGVFGTAYFEISSQQVKTNHIGKSHLYRGKIKTLFPYKEIKNIPVTLSIPIKKNVLRPLGNASYLVEGTLKEIEEKRYLFILNLSLIHI